MIDRCIRVCIEIKLDVLNAGRCTNGDKLSTRPGYARDRVAHGRRKYVKQDCNRRNPRHVSMQNEIRFHSDILAPNLFIRRMGLRQFVQ